MEDRVPSGEHLLDIRDLKVYFPLRSDFFRTSRKVIKAVDGVSLYIRKGETVGLVGESGCGKTTLGLASIRLIEPTAGSVYFEGVDIVRISKGKLRNLRKYMQIIFQNPYGALNPRKRIYEIVSEPMNVFKMVRSKKERREATAKLLSMVGMDPSMMDRYPHEFSGGERQRICIARAISLSPRLIVADEPLSALDVSIQAQIANILKDLQEQMNVSYLFISHDLKMVKFLSHIIAVMYLGRMVEIASAESLFLQPLHPYTRALMESIPLPDPHSPSPWRRKIAIGEVPSILNPPEGCRFRTRCPFSFDRCEESQPPFVEVKKDHKVACHLVTG